MIKKYPLDFYIKAIKYVDDHDNPEEGHYFERLWPFLQSKWNFARVGKDLVQGSQQLKENE